MPAGAKRPQQSRHAEGRPRRRGPVDEADDDEVPLEALDRSSSQHSSASEANEEQRKEDDSAFSHSLYATRSFNTVISYCLHYFGNVLMPAELEFLSSVNDLSTNAKELWLRLGLSKKYFHSKPRVCDVYGNWFGGSPEAVSELLSELAGTSITFSPTHPDGTVTTEHRNLLSITCARDIFTGTATNLSDVFSTVTVPQLRLVVRCMLDLTNSPEGVPTKKSELIDILMRTPDEAAKAWDSVVGDVVVFDALIRRQLSFFFELFQIIVPDYASIAQPQSRDAPPLASPSLVLASLHRGLYPMEQCLPLFANGSVGDDLSNASKVLPSLYMFRLRSELECFLDGLHLDTELFFATSFRKAEIDTTARHCYLHRVHTGLQAAIRFSANMDCLQPSNQSLLVIDELSQTSQYDEVDRSVRHSLRALFEDDPVNLNHVTRFFPISKWLACAEYVAPLLESAKEYEDAAVLYRALLETPVATTGKHQVHWHYRFRKRGHWVQRLVLCKHYLKEVKAAISIGEEAIANVKAEGSSRSRLLPLESTRDDRPAAVVARLQRHFMRRAEQISLERSLSRIWKQPHRWNPAPQILLAPGVLLDPPHVTIFGRRQSASADTQRKPQWIDRYQEESSVEGCALSWITRGRGRREQGWEGMHSEGSWASMLFTVLVGDVAFYEDQDVVERLTYFSPIQQAPWDADVPCALGCRRGLAIQSRLHCLKKMSRDQFVDEVVAYLTKHCPRLKDLNLKEHSESQDRNEAPLRWMGRNIDESLQIIQIAKHVPQRPLCELYECLLSRDLSEGHCFRFSGMPDLVTWRSAETVRTARSQTNDAPTQGACDDGRLYREVSGSLKQPLPSAARIVPVVGAPEFRLSEVKSPTDKLSDKQLAMNDLLLRCGFDVEVLHVLDGKALDTEQELAQRKAKRKKWWGEEELTVVEADRERTLEERKRLEASGKLFQSPAETRRIGAKGTSAQNAVAIE